MRNGGRSAAIRASALAAAAVGFLNVTEVARASSVGEVSMDERIDVLIASYPNAIAGRDGNALKLTSGREIIIDDGRAKSHQQKLANADIEDMLSQIYPTEYCDRDRPARNVDPGRIRNERLFLAIYGATPRAVQRKLVRVPWFGRSVRVTRAAGVDAALKRVAADLARLAPEHRVVFARTAGTFNWRRIARTRRLSVHAFAAAIDLNVKFADYWVWSGGRAGAVPFYRNKIPRAVVRVFERHGFIWGGKWYHYDTMHFEYRPELIEIARRAEKRGCVR